MKEYSMIRCLDLFFSGIAILLLAPILFPIAILLKLTGEHDVFYRQVRIGKGGQPFYILKFATMLRDSPNLQGGLITTKDDPRILPLGHFLRKTKLNELPQLINVFVGDMSLIGYRPFAEAHYNLYSDRVKEAISKIQPGLSGIGSIIFKNEEQILHRVNDQVKVHDSIITPYKGELEMWYVAHQSVTTYFIIIFLTLWVFIHPTNKAVWKLFKDLPPVPPELKDCL